MESQSRLVGKVMVVAPQGPRIDVGSASQFKGQLVDFITAGHRRLVIDMSNINFVDSSGLGVFISTLKSLGHDGAMAISGVGPQVMPLFKLTKMDRIIRILPTAEAAAAEIERTPAS